MRSRIARSIFPIRLVRDAAGAVRRLSLSPPASAIGRAIRRAPIVSAITGIGWIVLIACAVGWMLGTALGWREFVLAAATGTAALALSAAMMVGRTALAISVAPGRTRFTVGEGTDIKISITNQGRQRLALVAVHLAVGDEMWPVPMPFTLGGGHVHTDSLDLPGMRRGVVAVGPATSVRGDPFGLFQRRLRWGEATEVFIHPKTERLDPFGSGLLHDLEGRTTEDMSMSDLAFHTLREYAHGDDRRHIHWPSSARLATIRPEGAFLVRQFRDTRRTHVLVVVDGDRDAYADDEDFETAISVGASVGARAVLDRIDATLCIADQRPFRQLGHEASARRVLDTCARAGSDATRLERRVARAVSGSPNTTYALVVTGDRYPTEKLRRIAGLLSRSARVMIMSVNRDARSGVVVPGQPTVLNLTDLHELRGLIRRGDLA